MPIDHLRTEKALSGDLSPDELNPDEKAFCQEYKSIFEIGLMARRMAQGYYAHAAAIEVAKDPRAESLVATVTAGHPVPVGYVARKDGTRHVFDTHHYLGQARTNPAIADELPRIWLVGSLLSLGDALSRHTHRYLDRAPLLELVYHLRNGIAHGNVFHFDKNGKERLKKYPAHSKMAAVKSDTKAVFEIVDSLHGNPVLFDFMGPGDVLDVLQSVEVYLTRIREREAAGELRGLLRN
jgi:hypothetical protein